MARTTRAAPPRPRRAPSPGRVAAPRRRSAARSSPALPRRPLLDPEQRCELVGVSAIGAGVVLATVLAVPGGGTVAEAVHDRLISVLGAGSWFIAAGLAVAGARVLKSRAWSGGVWGIAGSGLTAVAVLGLLGLASSQGAGTVGDWVGPRLADRLGGPGAAAVLLVAALCGLVLAIEMRVAKVVESAATWLASRRAAAAAAAEAQVQTPPVTVPSPEEIPGLGPHFETMGRSSSRRRAEPEIPPPPTFPSLDLGLEPVDISLGDLGPRQTEPAAAAQVPAALAPFRREFEGLPIDVEAGGSASAAPAPVAAVDEPEKVWVLPTNEIFDAVSGKRERLEQEIRATASTIESTLASFGIDARIRGVNSGPTVTQYELQPAKGVPVRKITAHQTDLSLALAAPIRVQAPIPGKAAIGIEVPNKAAQLVTIREITGAQQFPEIRSRLAVALGADVSGHPVIGDLTRMPHMLIAGATGSGKSVCINAILAGFLLQATPAQLKLILVDPKRVELSSFRDLPHLLVPVVVETEAAVGALRWAVKEMEERYKLFASHGARNIVAFNERAPGLGLDPLPYTVIVIDELADLMMVAAGEIEDLICRIAQLARAVGIHLIVATQRPSADIITGLIKANIPSRVAFAVSSGVDSRVILDEMGAEKLLGRGDMLYLPIDEGKPRRLQGAFVSDRELERLIEFWRQQGLPDYQEEIFHVEATASWAREATKRDPLFAKAAHTVAAEGRAAASLLQRKLNVGYTRAARIIDQLAEARIVGPYEGSKSREMLMDVLQVDDYLAELGEE
jgi:S-DNA-T family DNA segregation ATPase FtsK/SpoIIIE